MLDVNETEGGERRNRRTKRMETIIKLIAVVSLVLLKQTKLERRYGYCLEVLRK